MMRTNFDALKGALVELPEKINVRSLFLRHHRGALNILPYGEIKRLRNTNRDWMIMVMDFRLTYDINLMTVKQIMKQVGDEIAAAGGAALAATAPDPTA